MQTALQFSFSRSVWSMKLTRAFSIIHTRTGTHTHTATQAQLDFSNNRCVFRHKTTRELIRGLLVLHACAIDPVVTHSYKLMNMGQRLMGERLMSLLIAPFYRQFVAGNTEMELRDAGHSIGKVGIRLMVAPMLETDLNEGLNEQELYKTNLDKTVWLIHQARQQTVLDGPRPICQTKMTAHLTADVLKRVSEVYQSLSLEGKVKAVRVMGQLMEEQQKRTERDITITEINTEASSSIRKLLLSLPLQESDGHRLLSCLLRLYQLGAACRDANVVLAVDAEYTYTNPAINLLSLALMYVFNRSPPLGENGCEVGRSDPIIWNTYQGYLKAGVENLKEDLSVASALGNNVGFGAKIVRGAYMEKERTWAVEQGRLDPVNDTFENTCNVYNRMVETMIEEVAKAESSVSHSPRSLIIATHNEESVLLAVERIIRLGLDPKRGSVVFGQIYGMAENISVPLATAGFTVYKSVPVGTLIEVMPYLSRRAAENRAVFRGARQERQLLAKELAARMMRRA